MNGLVSGYGSDSDEEPVKAKEENEIAKEAQVKGVKSVWTECLDTSSGYNYYWNMNTNEVRWEKPPDFVPPSTASVAPPKIPASEPLTLETLPVKTASGALIPSRKVSTASKPQSKTSKKSSSGASASSTTPLVPFGPTLPAEEIAAQKIRKFEEEFANGIINQIEKEIPMDWRNNMPHALHSTTFKWNSKEAVLPVYKSLVEEKAKTPAETGGINSISLIAGAYGASSDEEDTDEASPEKAGKKRKLPIQVKVGSKSKVAKPEMKPIPSIFQSSEYDSDKEEAGNKNGTEDEAEKETEPKEAESVESRVAPAEQEKKKEKQAAKKEKRDSRGRRIYESSLGGASYKKSIDDVAETLCDKLEALNVAAIKISPTKLLACKIETLFAAWQAGALTPAYMQKILSELAQQMIRIEQNELAPPGWKASWDRSVRKYSYENLVTGEIQFDKPDEEEEDYADDQDVIEEEEEDIQDVTTTVERRPKKGSKDQRKRQRGKTNTNGKKIQEATCSPGPLMQPPLPPSPSSGLPPLPPGDGPPPLPPSEIEEVPLPQPPPLKESLPPLPPLPPPPPEISPPKPPSPPKISDGVEDMDLEEEDTEDEDGDAMVDEIIEHGPHNQPRPEEQKPQISSAGDHLSSALNSFYASLGGDTATGSGANTPSSGATPPMSHSPTPPIGGFEDGSNSPGPSNIVSGNEERKVKKRTKISSGLSMKKKGVGNLVAKWQNIQDEVKRTS